MVRLRNMNSAPLPGLLEKPRSRRPARVAEMIQHEVGMLLLSKIKDPRLAQVSITRVTVTGDLSQARIFYSVLSENEADRAMQGLASATGFIRSKLAKVLPMRGVPRLIFERDPLPAEQERLERLFRELKRDHEPSP